MTAALHGVLDPKATEANEGGTYEFVYEPFASECKGAGEVKTPEEPSLGFGKKEVSDQVTGLKPDTEYAVCLVVRSEAWKKRR